MNEELTTLLQQLEPLQFPGISDKLAQAAHECSAAVSEILYTNRISLYFMISSESLVHVQRTFTTNDLLNSASMQPLSSLSVFEPLEVQSMTYLIKSLHSDIPTFAQKVTANIHNPGSRYLALVTIPAVFSFYSSNEMASLAYNFYLSLLFSLPYDIFCSVSFPFFNSSCSAPFLQLLFRDFFLSECISSMKPQKVCQELLQMTADRIMFLADSQIALLRIISLQKTKNELWALIAKILLLPQLRLHVTASPYANNEARPFDLFGTVKILRTVGTKSYKQPLPDLILTQSRFEVPQFSNPKQQSCSNDIILTLADIQSLLSLNLTVPHHITRLNELCRKPIDPLSPFVIHFVLRIKQSSSDVQRPIFNFPQLRPTKLKCPESSQPFQNSLAQIWQAVIEAAETMRCQPLELLTQGSIDPSLTLKLSQFKPEVVFEYGMFKTVQTLSQSSDQLEELLKTRLSLSQLNNFLTIIKDFNKVLSIYTSERLFVLQIPFPLIPSIQFWKRILTIETKEQSIKKDPSLQLEGMESRYRTLVRGKINNLISTPFLESPVLQQHMWLSNGLLPSVRRESRFSVRYRCLMCYIEEIERIAIAGGFEDSTEEFGELIHFSLAASDFDWILPTVALIDGIVYGDENFDGIFEVDLWKRFFVVFLKFIAADDGLIALYSDVVSSGKLMRSLTIGINA